MAEKSSNNDSAVLVVESATTDLAAAGDTTESVHSAGSQDDLDLALQGITLLMNDKWAEAEQLFNKYKDESPRMSFGASFVMVMQGIMSFEDEKLQAALTALKETEKKCEVPTGFAKNLKKKKRKGGSLEERLIRQIVTADCLLYQSLLTFINQDLSSYVKGGWILRKAWKLYEKTFKEVHRLHANASSRDNSSGFPAPPSVPQDRAFPETPTDSSMKKSPSKTSVTSDASNFSVDSQEQTELELDVAARLLGSVSFGYGMLQLIISLVPPKILKLIEFFGFDGDRQEGVNNLDFASKTRNMKAPLAMFALVWYHTVIRPFFALDGLNVNAGIEDAECVIERCRVEYPESALYLYFKARVHRLKAEVDESFSLYKLALEKCATQREIQLITLYEMGWIHMMRLEYQDAYKCFLQLKEDSRWSKCYYSYLTAICQGAFGDVKGAHVTMKEVPGLQKRKNNQLEQFVTKRAQKFKKTAPTQEHLILLMLEVLYLWGAIPHCKKDDLRRHMEECNIQNDKKLFHLRSLIEGSIYQNLESEDLSIQCYEEAIVRQNGMKEDKHVAAFASYELGTIYVQNPDKFIQAKKYFMQAKEQYKDFDFDNRLHVRVNAALKRMKSEGTPL